MNRYVFLFHLTDFILVKLIAIPYSGESSELESLKTFCAAIVKIYGNAYPQSPNEEEKARISAVSEMQGFPRMMGSLNCMHWTWKNCPIANQGKYSGKEGKPTIILEAVATHDL